MDFVVTQTGVHTLSLTTNAWLSMFNKETEVPLFSHYVLCNETHDTIHIKQVNKFFYILVYVVKQIYSICAEML